MLLLLPPLVRGTVPGIPAAFAAAAVLGAAFAVSDRWWVGRIHRHELEAALTRACRMVRAATTSTSDGLRVQIVQDQLLIRIRGHGSRTFELRFEGTWHAHRKAMLVRSAIAKQFEPLLPRIRIRLRREPETMRR